jgi:hypothetical protein
MCRIERWSTRTFQDKIQGMGYPWSDLQVFVVSDI